jgi:hypothetical protein
MIPWRQSRFWGIWWGERNGSTLTRSITNEGPASLVLQIKVLYLRIFDDAWVLPTCYKLMCVLLWTHDGVVATILGAFPNVVPLLQMFSWTVENIVLSWCIQILIILRNCTDVDFLGLLGILHTLISFSCMVVFEMMPSFCTDFKRLEKKLQRCCNTWKSNRRMICSYIQSSC